MPPPPLPPDSRTDPHGQGRQIFVNISAQASDADGDATTLEWENKGGRQPLCPRAPIPSVPVQKTLPELIPLGQKRPLPSRARTDCNPLTATPNPNKRITVNSLTSPPQHPMRTANLNHAGMGKIRRQDNYYAVGYPPPVSIAKAMQQGCIRSGYQGHLQSQLSADCAGHHQDAKRQQCGRNAGHHQGNQSDPDGDPVTLVWEGRNAETQTYPLGRNGACQSGGFRRSRISWSAIVFFVADSNGRRRHDYGPDSVMRENYVSCHHHGGVYHCSACQRSQWL